MKRWIIINFWFTLANCTKRSKIITTTAKKNKPGLNYIANVGIYISKKQTKAFGRMAICYRNIINGFQEVAKSPHRLLLLLFYELPVQPRFLFMTAALNQEKPDNIAMNNNIFEKLKAEQHIIKITRKFNLLDFLTKTIQSYYSYI